MLKKYPMLAVVCLALGLAPFVPEPHIVGKVRWILGGAQGMALLDWVDVFLHGTPWLVLVYMLGHDLVYAMRHK